jgi:general secretion pathway protein C
MSWNNVVSQAAEQAKRLPQQKIATFISYAAVAMIAYQLSGLTWQLIPVSSPKGANNISISASDLQVAPRQEANVRGIIALQLFGNPDKSPPPPPPPPEQKDITVTKLNAKLYGVLASPDKALASAIIELDRKQDSYQIGSKLGKYNAIVDEIHPSHVIIRNNGKLEKLELQEGPGGSFTVDNSAPSFPTTSNDLTPPEADIINKADDIELSEKLAEVRNNLISDPTSFAKLIRLRPIKRNGVVTGYRVRPGRDRATFKRSGLQRNDIIRSINGVQFSDPSATMGLLSELATMKEVSLEVDRRGQKFNIVLGFGQ